jgi:hypothetical protein
MAHAHREGDSARVRPPDHGGSRELPRLVLRRHIY